MWLVVKFSWCSVHFHRGMHILWIKTNLCTCDLSLPFQAPQTKLNENANTNEGQFTG